MAEKKSKGEKLATETTVGEREGLEACRPGGLEERLEGEQACGGTESPSAGPAKSPAPRAPLGSVRRGFLAGKKPSPASPSSLASATGTSPMVLGALKAAYRWTDRTKLTRQDFLRKRDDWLKGSPE